MEGLTGMWCYCDSGQCKERQSLKNLQNFVDLVMQLKEVDTGERRGGGGE